MTEFEVKVERPSRAPKRAVVAPFGFDPLKVAAMFVAAMMVFTYALCLARFGAFAQPIEYLYPGAFVILVLLLLPGILPVCLFHTIMGIPIAADLRTMIVIIAISAVAYGALAERVLKERMG